MVAHSATRSQRAEEREIRDRADAIMRFMGSVITATSWRGTCPTATSAASRWRAPWPPTRSSWSWTSRPPGSNEEESADLMALIRQIRDSGSRSC